MKERGMDLSTTLFSELDPDKLKRKFLEALLTMQNVDRGSIWISEGEAYVCIEAAGAQSESIRGARVPRDKPSIVGWVMENGRMTIAEPGKDKRHFKELEDALAVKSTLILCYPLVLRDGSVYGAVEIIDTSHGGRRLDLSKEYLGILEELVSLGAAALGNALAFQHERRETRRLKTILKDLHAETPIIGHGPAFSKVMALARDYARTDFPVLITGESGTGKELLAREIHRLSPRSKGPFLIQNVTAIPDTLLESELFGYKKGAFTGADKDKIGLFEAADGGAVFLDEIGDMPLSLQARVLRVLQENEIKPLGGTATLKVDVRLISATNKDLPRAIAAGEFREDLFYRLNVLPLRLPALRERPEDIPALLDYFFRRDAARLGQPQKRVGAKAMRLLTAHPWRGNVREMENFARYLLATAPGQTIEPEDLPPHFLDAETGQGGSAPAGALGGGAAGSAGPGSPRPIGAEAAGPAAGTAPGLAGYTWEELDRAYALALLEACRWNVTKAAARAGVNRSTFDSRLKKLGINKS